jgi:hypothetical protein
VTSDTGDDIRQIRDDLTELVTISSRNSTILEAHGRDVEALKEQMRLALLPIILMKYAVVVVTAVGAVSGVIYGLLKGLAAFAIIVGAT